MNHSPAQPSPKPRYGLSRTRRALFSSSVAPSGRTPASQLPIEPSRKQGIRCKVAGGDLFALGPSREAQDLEAFLQASVMLQEVGVCNEVLPEAGLHPPIGGNCLYHSREMSRFGCVRGQITHVP